MKKFFYNWFPVILLTAAIFALSSSSRIQTPPGSDKIWHVLAYSLMGFLTTRGVLLTWNPPRFWGMLGGAILGTFLGVMDEFHQRYVPGRHPSVGDGIADLIGAILGSLLFIYLGVAIYKSRKLYPRPHDKCC